MIRYLLNLFVFLGTSLSLLRKAAFQRRFNKRVLDPLLEESRQTMDFTLEEKDYRRISYYGTGATILFGESCATLRGEKLNEKERRTMTFLAAMTGLFDDFFDKWNTPEQRILELIDNPPGLPVSTSNEKLFVRLNTLVLESCADPQKLKTEALRVYEAQLNSKKQADPRISTKELEAIILEKGGCSPILYRGAIHPPMEGNEEAVLFKLGGMYQLVNDIFDTWKDQNEGVQTLATREKDIVHLRTHYLTHLKDFIAEVKKSALKPWAQRQFIRIHMILFSRGFVCLDMLERNQKSSGNVFDVTQYTRKQLICDMEKPANLLRNVHYFAKYNAV